MDKIKVWDSPTRLFHWALVICILGAWLTIENGWIEAHKYFGLSLLLLVIFRLCWGVVGSTTARFSHFLTAPNKAFKYLVASLHSSSEHHTGHNPAGGWMVILMLALLIFQSVSGLFSNNDLGFTGPLADNISKQWSDILTQWHALSFNFIVVAVWLHLVAIFFYVLVKKQNLVKAMFSGCKPKNQTKAERNLTFVHPIKAFILLLLIGCVVYWYLV
ncbi:cytochrome b/b6 domain-containing protein [Paraglaciecola sp.]|uniref:cytochrome b/b6 domain-containing protein n=1 Tax=Paraglaciecola sp. TaxID=1920173 RepID=UPI003EF4F328